MATGIPDPTPAPSNGKPGYIIRNVKWIDQFGDAVLGAFFGLVFAAVLCAVAVVAVESFRAIVEEWGHVWKYVVVCSAGAVMGALLALRD